MTYNNVGAMTMAIDGSGRIDVAGEGASGPVVARYLPDGVLDTSFGTGGIAGPLPLDATNGVGLQSTGKIVAYGLSSGGEGASLVRLNTDGSLDTTFGTNGVYVDTRIDSASSIVIQPNDDEIVALGAGWVNGQVDFNFWVTLVLADGSAYDSTFGTNGLAEADFNNTSESGASSVALDSWGESW